MYYNKHNLAVTKFAAKTDLKPALACVMFKDDITVGTNSWALMEVKAPIANNVDAKPIEKTLIYAKEIAKTKFSKAKTIVAFDDLALNTKKCEEKFPEYDQIFPKESEIVMELHVNGRMLSELLKAMADVNEYDAVTIKLTNEKRRPITIESKGQEGQSARALFMPLLG